MIRSAAIPWAVLAGVLLVVTVAVVLEPWRHVVAFRGATAYEAQVGRVCARLPYARFLRAGAWPRVYLAPKDDAGSHADRRADYPTEAVIGQELDREARES